MSQSVPRLSLAARVFPVLAAVFAAALHSMAPTSGATAAPATGLLAAPGEALARAGLRLVVKNSTYGKYLAAGHAESVHDYATAAELIAEVLAERPDDPELLSRGHRLMAMAGRMEDAVRLARHLLEVEPADPEAQVVVAAHEIKMGAHEAAADRLEAIERSGANQLIVPLLRAWALAGADELEDGLDELEALAEEGAFEVFAALHAGLIADYAGDAEAAEEGYSRAQGAARGLPLRLVEAYGSYLSRAGRSDEAKAIMTAFLEQQPDDLLLEEARARLAAGRELAPMVSAPSDGVAEVLSSVARRLASEGASAEAMPYARMALDLRPDDPLSQLLLAEILSNLGRTDDALIAFEAVDRSSPYAWTARLNEAQTLETLDRMADAVALLRRMVDERPERSDAAQALGNILRFNERFREAVKAYDVAIDRLDAIEQRHWRLLYARGIALERSKQWELAEDDFLTALELEPDQPLVLNYLGYSWVELGVNIDQAREMIEKAVEQRPRDGFIVDSLGWVLYRLGSYSEAVSHLERAVALEPGDPVINDHLGDAYWIVGRAQEAEFQWQRALGAEPDDELEQKIRDKLAGRERPTPMPVGERDS